MTPTVHMTHSGVFPIPVADAFDQLLPMPLSDLFATWYGPIPPIKATVQGGIWGNAGQERTVVFVGPGSVHEELLHVDRPHEFRYELTRPTGPLALVVARVNGSWVFTPAGSGTRITWVWKVEPRNRVTQAAMPVFAALWRGYARASFSRLEGLLRSS